MTRDALIEGFAARAEADDRVLALLLGGSLGAGTGDAHSDVDLILVTSPADHPVLVETLRPWAEAVTDLVLWRRPYPAAPLFNAITPDWVRFDVTVTIPGRVTGARTRLKPLMDRAEVWAGLPERLPPRPRAPAEVEAMAEEFLRVLGLMVVAVGRGEFAGCVTGVGLLRSQLIALMVAETEPALPPGALHLSRLLPAADMALLEALPPVAATRDSTIAANLELARLYLPRARRLAARVGATWPEAFEAATRANIRRHLGLEFA